MIRKSGRRFSEKIMLHQNTRAPIDSILKRLRFGGPVAQRRAHRFPKPKVASSNLAGITNYGELAERQGIAVLTRRDLRVGQVRLLHSPPVRGLGIWVVHQPSKLTKRVRVSQPAPLRHVRLAAQDARLSSGMTSVRIRYVAPFCRDAGEVEPTRL
jgi:hypothetical protein